MTRIGQERYIPACAKVAEGKVVGSYVWQREGRPGRELVVIVGRVTNRNCVRTGINILAEEQSEMHGRLGTLASSTMLSHSVLLGCLSLILLSKISSYGPLSVLLLVQSVLTTEGSCPYLDILML